MAQPGFWDNQEKAQETVAELKSLTAILKPMTELAGASDDVQVMLEMGDEDAEIAAELPQELDRLESRLEEL
jgi:peptide chain release factor 2